MLLEKYASYSYLNLRTHLTFAFADTKSGMRRGGEKGLVEEKGLERKKIKVDLTPVFFPITDLLRSIDYHSHRIQRFL